MWVFETGPHPGHSHGFTEVGGLSEGQSSCAVEKVPPEPGFPAVTTEPRGAWSQTSGPALQAALPQGPAQAGHQAGQGASIARLLWASAPDHSGSHRQPL